MAASIYHGSSFVPKSRFRPYPKDPVGTGLFNLGDSLVPKLRTRQRWNGRATVPTNAPKNKDIKGRDQMQRRDSYNPTIYGGVFTKHDKTGFSHDATRLGIIQSWLKPKVNLRLNPNLKVGVIESAMLRKATSITPPFMVGLHQAR